MDFKLKVMLRRTTAPMVDLCRGRIWEDVFHSTKAVREMIAREEWLGCWHDASPMFNIPGSTPVWAQCIFRFSIYKIYVYVYCFQNLYVVQKEHWWILISSWPDEVQRVFSTAH